MEFAQKGKDTLIAGGLMLVALLLSPGVAFAAPPGGSTKNRIDALEAQVSALEAQVEALMTFVQAVEPFISVNPDPMDGLAGPHIIFEGVNVHVRSGSGATDDGWWSPEPGPPPAGALTGLGNLVVGYNEDAMQIRARAGSHNLVVGEEHAYSSYGGFVAGYNNNVTGEYSSVSGGSYNIASGGVSSVSGGQANGARGALSSVSGGTNNNASGWGSSICGGSGNAAVAGESSVSGGSLNTASGRWSSVSGGSHRNAPTAGSWAAGSLLQPN
jgi:hypothetical protein